MGPEIRWDLGSRIGNKDFLKKGRAWTQVQDWDSTSHVQGPLGSSAHRESGGRGIEAEKQDLNANTNMNSIQ